MGQFDWTPDEYLERIRARIPRYDELQEQAVAAIPFPPERVLELGMGTGETTRRLIEAYPEAWVIGLDSSPDMVFRARQTYDDVQLARMEDPLPDGPWDLVISVLSVNDLEDEQKQTLFRRVRDHSRSLVIGDVFEPGRAGEGRRVVRGRGHLAGRTTWRWSAPPIERRRYHSATDGRPEEENLERPPRQAARHAQGRRRPVSTAARAATARASRTGSARPAAPTRDVR